MRRIWIISAFVALCLPVAATPVIGQDAAASVEMKPAVVSGEDVCGGTVCEMELSDPRVSGKLFLSWNDEVSLPGATVAWGTARLQGPDGQWTGRFVSTMIKQTSIDYVLGMAGSSDYEGWAFVATRSESRTGDATPVRGVIYEGKPPAALAPDA